MADAIRKLIEAVEAGDEDAMMENARAIWRADLDRGIVPDIDPYGMAKAFDGDLNAANALHDALMPEWGYLISKHDAEIWREGEYPNTIAAQVKDNPARAWLLAILRAKEAEGRG